MGRQNIDELDSAALRAFSKSLLTDLRALESMLESGAIESDKKRIGAEQEIFLVDENWRPVPSALAALEAIDDPHFTTELGAFNLEFNLDPISLGGDCLAQMEANLNALMDLARTGAEKVGARVVLSGILPTLQKTDLTLDNMTPKPRYRALNDAMNRLRGENYNFRIQGRDELFITHDNVMLEACNTSFQVHFQVAPAEFARRYNIAQAVAAPAMAAATNSPLLFGRHLWRETRIALFEQSIDTRTPTEHLRQQSPRVSFGRGWIEQSVVEIFQEDISRFRVLLGLEDEEDPFEAIAAGRAPKLDALRLHNGTVYRWNRPCYGISEGKPHLRIENRVLPAGPTPIDEVANAAFWFGLMGGVGSAYEDITQQLDFDVARENFVAAARQGLGSHLFWPGRGTISAPELILEELLPLAREGLAGMDIDSSCIDRYLGTLEDRVKSLKTGSRWQIDSLAAMKGRGSETERLAALVAGTERRQREGNPVHTWELATIDELQDARHYHLRVEQLMTTDLFTVHEEELVDIVAFVMRWKHVRHIPVEDSKHRLVGLVTHRTLLRLLSEDLRGEEDQAIPVRDVMETRLVTARPDTPTLEAIRLMREHRVGCLPVIDNSNRLVGIITERDFMGIAGQLLEKYLAESTPE